MKKVTMFFLSMFIIIIMSMICFGCNISDSDKNNTDTGNNIPSLGGNNSPSIGDDNGTGDNDIPDNGNNGNSNPQTKPSPAKGYARNLVPYKGVQEINDLQFANSINLNNEYYLYYFKLGTIQAVLRLPLNKKSILDLVF